MIKEKRTLPIGIEHNGKVHRDLEIEARRVAHMLDALEEEKARENIRYREICMYACQVVKLGDIPKEEITGELLLSMFPQDFEVLTEAADTAQTRAETFQRGNGETQGDQ